jgi:hypothetical protein
MQDMCSKRAKVQLRKHILVVAAAAVVVVVVLDHLKAMKLNESDL